LPDCKVWDGRLHTRTRPKPAQVPVRKALAAPLMTRIQAGETRPALRELSPISAMKL
jgi:hypothetical protein